MTIIELNNIFFNYDGEDVNVFENFSLSIEDGECVVITGDNGSGKTTLFRILNGLSFVKSGKYIFNGTEINSKYLKDNSNSKRFHKQIGYLFQNPDVMLFNATVYDEIAFGPRQMGTDDNEVDRRVRDCLELFELKSIVDKAPYHLSGGQKKKVALASIISLNPDIIILDEPFAGLDKRTLEWLMGFLEGLKAAGKTLIIASHNYEHLKKIADREISL